MNSRRDRQRGDRWVNMGQQRNPAPRFASQFDCGEVPDPVGKGDWDGEGGWDDGEGDAEGETIA